jgi:hypothetical protein
MKKIAFIILFQVVCLTVFSENPRWKYADDMPIPAHADLDVRWEASMKTFPSKMWIYQLEPRKFSSKVISNLMFMCSFTEKDKVQQDSNGVTFKSSDGLRTLVISFSSGSIHYDMPEPRYAFLKTNLLEGVPETKEMPKLTKNFLKKIGGGLSEVQKNTNGAPAFHFSDRGENYFLKQSHTFVTKTWSRVVTFKRSVDGAEVLGNPGYCQLYFGEHGKISKIDFTWPDLKRYKSAPTLKPDAIIRLLREGKARQGATLDSIGYIDWPSVKSVTIKQAWPCYFAGDFNYLYPFLALWTTVDTGHGSFDVGIDCPIIDESQN